MGLINAKSTCQVTSLSGGITLCRMIFLFLRYTRQVGTDYPPQRMISSGTLSHNNLRPPTMARSFLFLCYTRQVDTDYPPQRIISSGPLSHNNLRPPAVARAFLFLCYTGKLIQIIRHSG